MTHFLGSQLGRLRLTGFFEGLSLITLVCIAVPAKYAFDHPELVKALGPVHGVLFVLYVIQTFQAAIELDWKFSRTTWKVLVGCLIPFGTFYVDRQILRPLNRSSKNIR